MNEHNHSADNIRFQFPSGIRILSFVFMAIGIAALIGGFMFYKGELQTRVWANLLLDSVFFLGIGMASGFFIAAHYLAWGGWSVVIKRVPEAISQFVPVAALILLIVLAAGHFHLYEWTHKDVIDSDPIIRGKTPYLNLPFFFIRFTFFLGALTTLIILLRRSSLAEDTTGGTHFHNRSVTLAAIFIPIFAVYISVSAWDWLMSLDTHWFSTMFGWYAFASFWVTGIAVITLIVIYLKSRGYLPLVNYNHLHDLGKYMFAFSIFWTYLTFCQFMLIWYANIPEETIYFKQRYEHYHALFYAIFLINFCFPFLVLMTRDAKRKMNVLVIAAAGIIIGHFLDFYLMIMPGTVRENGGFSFLEFLLPFFFIGLFIFVVFTSLTKAALVPRNHPFLQESIHHHT